MEIGQTNLVTTSSKSIQPDEFLWYAIVETEGFLSGLFACIAYNLEKMFAISLISICLWAVKLRSHSPSFLPYTEEKILNPTSL